MRTVGFLKAARRRTHTLTHTPTHSIPYICWPQIYLGVQLWVLSFALSHSSGISSQTVHCPNSAEGIVRSNAAWMSLPSPPPTMPSRVAGSGSAVKWVAARWPSPTAILWSSTSRGSTKGRPLASPAAIAARTKAPMPQARLSSARARGKGLRRPTLVHLPRGRSHTKRQRKRRLEP